MMMEEVILIVEVHLRNFIFYYPSRNHCFQPFFLFLCKVEKKQEIQMKNLGAVISNFLLEWPLSATLYLSLVYKINTTFFTYSLATDVPNSPEQERPTLESCADGCMSHPDCKAWILKEYTLNRFLCVCFCVLFVFCLYFCLYFVCIFSVIWYLGGSLLWDLIDFQYSMVHGPYLRIENSDKHHFLFSLIN